MSLPDETAQFQLLASRVMQGRVQVDAGSVLAPKGAGRRNEFLAESAWKQHRSETGISRAEYDTYLDGAAQAPALLLEAPERLEEPVPLAHLRADGTFHPPQSYRYIAEDALRGLVTGHAMADVLLDRLTRATPTASVPSTARASGGALRSAVLLVGPTS